MSGRPSYWEIVVAYLEEGYRAWLAREVAEADRVEPQLGLSPREGVSFRRELETQGLIEIVPLLERAIYRLSPRGLAFVERMPDVQRLLAMQTAAINASSSGEDEKRQATFSLRDEVYKTALSKGADAVIQNAGTIWNTVRTLYGNLPEQWWKSL